MSGLWVHFACNIRSQKGPYSISYYNPLIIFIYSEKIEFIRPIHTIPTLTNSFFPIPKILFLFYYYN